MFTKFDASDLGANTTAEAGDTVWLNIRSDVTRLVRMFSYSLVAVAVTACVVAGLWITLQSAARDRLFVMAVLVRYLLPILVVLWAFPYYRSSSWIALSLGSDGRRVMLRARNGREIASAPLSAVYTDGEYLLIGRRLVPLHHLHRDAYDTERLRADIIGRLPPTAFAKRNTLWWRALRAGNHGLILTLLFIGVVCVEKATL
jgi:hypothetical protein